MSANRHDVPRATVHDIQLLVVLLVAGLGVAVDDLDRPLGILELHLLLLIYLVGNLLLAFPLTGRHATMVRLLLIVE
jgi:hypothetical protein